MKVIVIYQKYTQALENIFKNAEKKLFLRKRAVLTSKKFKFKFNNSFYQCTK